MAEEIVNEAKAGDEKRKDAPPPSSRTAAGTMERQQLSGGRHDLFTSQRQRESGSSRGEADLTSIRRTRTPGPKTCSVETEGRAAGPGRAGAGAFLGGASSGAAGGSPAVEAPGHRAPVDPGELAPAVDDPKTGGAGPAGSSTGGSAAPEDFRDSRDERPRRS